MNRIDLFVKQVTNELDVDDQSKSEVYDELNDHLQMSKQNYIENGLSEDEAEGRAISDFGESKLIGRNLQKTCIQLNIFLE